ncbi:MAG: DUF3179 domain-containing protein [Rhodospirillales bacterium]|nr:DUF3179 domain-containing protein [Rhodospirillales bacterium]
MNIILYVVGTASLLHSYMAFSPMTRDMVAFLSRDAQINIFKHRHKYWAVGIFCLGLLMLRAINGLAGSETTAMIGTAHWVWLVIGGFTIAGLSVLYWALYVPVVMAPPVKHFLVGIDEADGILKPDSVVLGIEMHGEVRAYPRDLIARPHWFNDEFGGRPLMISYCILCNSGQAFVPVLKDGRRLDLRNMTAFDNNTIYHCTKTGNFIQQLAGRVIRGPNEGEVLEAFPVVMARWDEWKRLHPDTKMYYAPPETLRDRTVQKMLMKMIPLSRLAARDKPWHIVRKDIDTRLPAMSFVFGVKINDETCAYPSAALKDNPVINDTVGTEPIVVLYDKAHDIGQVFLSRAGDQVLTFAEVPNNDGASLVAKDKETGTTWNVSGHAIEGPLAGSVLTPAPHWNQLFWFSWAAFNPGTRINEGAAKADDV